MIGNLARSKCPFVGARLRRLGHQGYRFGPFNSPSKIAIYSNMNQHVVDLDSGLALKSLVEFEFNEEWLKSDTGKTLRRIDELNWEAENARGVR